MMTCQAIIVTHQSAAVLADSLEALRHIPGVSTLVIDNASTDGSAEIAGQLGAQVIRLDHNAGFAAAANEGARRAEADVLCFLNPDCLLDEATVSSAHAILRTRPKTCAVPDFDQPNGHVSGCQPGYTRRKLLADILETNGWNPSGLIERLKAHPSYHDGSWLWPLGSCVFIRRDFFKQLGGFDPCYFLYMEDVELGLAIRNAGGTVLPTGTVVRHIGMHGSTITRPHRMKLLNRGRLLFARRHFGPAYAAALRGALSLATFRARKAAS